MPSFTSDHLEPMSAQLFKAIAAAISDPILRSTHDYHILPDILRSISMWKSRPILFTELAYDCCSLICEQSPDINEALLFLSLEIGFRHLDYQDKKVGGGRLTHTEYHQEMADVVFKNGDGEVVADLLHAWMSEKFPYSLLDTCARYLVDLQRLQPFSPRLRHLLIRAVQHIGYPKFERIEGEGFFELLDHLHIRIGDVDDEFRWGKLLSAAIRSTKGLHRLPDEYWELLAELTISSPRLLRITGFYDQHVMKSLEEAKEWGKLRCWFCAVWASWGPNKPHSKEADLKSVALSFFRSQPGAYEKVEGWMERLGQPELEAFRQMCPRANLSAIGGDTL